MNEDSGLKQEREHLWSRDPAQVLLVKHLEGIHHVEVTLLGQLLLCLLQLFLIQDHFVEHLDKLTLILGSERADVHLQSALHYDGAWVHVRHLCHWWSSRKWIGMRALRTSGGSLIKEVHVDVVSSGLALLVDGVLEAVLPQRRCLSCHSLSVCPRGSSLDLGAWTTIKLCAVSGSWASLRTTTWKLSSLQLLILIVQLQVHIDRILLRDWLRLRELLEEWTRLRLIRSLVPGKSFILVFSELDVSHPEDDWVEALDELFVLYRAVTLAFNPSDDGDELFVAGIVAILIQEAVQVEMIYETLALTVQKVEGSSGVPVRTLVQLVLQHLHLDVYVELALEEVSKTLLHRRVEPLATLGVNFKGLPLAHVLSQLRVITRQHKLHELCILNAAAIVQVIELHHQLHVLDAELATTILLQERIDVVGVHSFVAVAIDSAESGIGLKVVQVG